MRTHVDSDVGDIGGVVRQHDVSVVSFAAGATDYGSGAWKRNSIRRRAGRGLFVDDECTFDINSN